MSLFKAGWIAFKASRQCGCNRVETVELVSLCLLAMARAGRKSSMLYVWQAKALARRCYMRRCHIRRAASQRHDMQAKPHKSEAHSYAPVPIYVPARSALWIDIG